MRAEMKMTRWSYNYDYSNLTFPAKTCDRDCSKESIDPSFSKHLKSITMVTCLSPQYI